MAASQYGHVEVVDKLIQHGATVELQDEVINRFLSLIILWSGGSHYCVFEAWFLVYSQVTLLFYVLGWLEFTDFGILQRTCQSCGEVAGVWSKTREHYQSTYILYIPLVVLATVQPRQL